MQADTLTDMPFYTLRTGSPILYPEGRLLPPDSVTEMLADEASLALNEMPLIDRPRHMLELGISTGGFCRSVLDRSDITLDITGIDTNPIATTAAYINLHGHRNLGRLTLAQKDWTTDDAFAGGPFDCVYFNPPYHRPGRKLRPEFANAPHDAVYSEDPAVEYAILPRIVQNLTVGGFAIIRYPGNGILTFAGEDAKANHSPWVTFQELDRTCQRLEARTAWLAEVMPADTACFSWRTHIGNMRVSAEMFARTGGDMANAPRLIRSMDAYWEAQG